MTGVEAAFYRKNPALKGGARALRASTRLMPRFLGVLAFAAGTWYGTGLGEDREYAKRAREDAIVKQVQDTATRWLWTYNHERPNMALGGITPAMKLAMAA